MRSFIIHMPGTPSRAENVARLLVDLPDAEVVNAVDGRNPDLSTDVEVLPGTLHHPPYPFALNPGEIGCFLSHRKCWKKIAQGDEPFGLIAEDDLTFEPQTFRSAIALAERHANAECFIRLPTKSRERPSSSVARQGSANLFLPKTIGLQTVCQIVGRNAARRLLDATTAIDRPVDTTLQMHWITGQQVWTVLPNGTSELNDGSTIQGKPRTSDILMREMRRATYRAKIRRKPQDRAVSA